MFDHNDFEAEDFEVDSAVVIVVPIIGGVVIG